MSNAAPVTIELRDGDPELLAISHCIRIIENFDEQTRERMLNYLCERFTKIVTAERKK